MVNVQPLTSAELAALAPADRSKYLFGNDEEKQQIAIDFRNKDGEKSTDVKGTQVENNPDSKSLTEEELIAKQQAQQAQQNEIMQMKAAAVQTTKVEDPKSPPEQPVAQDPNANDDAKLRRLEDENKLLKEQLAQQNESNIKVLNDFERDLAQKAVEESGSNDPLYKNAEAKRKLKLKVKEEMLNELEEHFAEAGSTDKKTKRLSKQLARKGARVISRDIAIGDRIEHTRVVDSQQEKRELKDGMSRKLRRETRVRTHVKSFIRDENVNLYTKMKAKGLSSHEAAIELVDNASGDRTFEPNEVRTAASKSSTDVARDKKIEKELRRLGYKVKDDTWKNILAGVATGALAAGGAGSLPIILSATKETLEKFQWGITVETTVDVEGKIWPKGNAALAGGIAAIMTGALFGGTEDEDILHGNAVEQIFKTDDNGKRAYENISFGNRKQTEKVKIVLRAIDELDLTDEQKTGFLTAAAGEGGQKIVSSKELVLAYVNAALNENPEIAETPKKDEVPKQEKPPVLNGTPEGDGTPVLNDTPEGDGTPVLNDTPEGDGAPVLNDTPEGDRTPVLNETPQKGGVVTVMNGESFNKLAKKYNVDVNELKALNKDKIHKYKDCNGKVHYFFRVGEKITLPDNANQEAVKYNQDNVDSKTEIGKYTKKVTSEENVKKLADENCDRKTKAQGTQVDKLVQEELARRAAQTEETTNTTQKEETAKAETPKVETPKAETPKVETPKKDETPKVETPKAETPKQTEQEWKVDTNKKAPVFTGKSGTTFQIVGNDVWGSKISTDRFNTDKLNNGEIKVKYPFDGGLFVKDSQGNKYKVVTSGKAGDYSLMVIVDNKKIPLEEFLNSH